jgi:hypothetical protein
MFKLPESFNPDTFESIPYGTQTLFEGKQPELEALGKEAIRQSLEKRLGLRVVGRDDILHRHGLRKFNLTQNDLMSGKVTVR